MNTLQVPLSDDRTIRPNSWPIEIVLLLALLGTINILFFPGDPGFMGTTPHPLWLIILPVAARYGFFPGLTAGMCCAAIHFSLTIHAAPDPTWADLKHFSIWKLPFLFTLIGGALGEVREIQKRRYATLRSRHLELSREAADLQERHALLLQSKEELDLRIITQEQTLSTLYDATHNLRLLDEKAILPALLDLLSEQLDISQAAAYRVSETELVLSTHIGSSEDIPTTLVLKKDVAARVLDDRRTWTIRDNLNEIEAGPQFLIMAPILAADQKTVFGILAVRDIPFEKFTPSGIKIITLLADWGGTSLDNARQFSVVKDQLITDESGYAFTFAYFQSRIIEEINRSKRYGSVFSI
ncbi:MAG TPA: hypothetical protein VJ934_07575, partial [Desulfomicrobiaceae bacterium]|nr:hypothetical protein [Desulfomicrobiaceae bacterium]